MIPITTPDEAIAYVLAELRAVQADIKTDLIERGATPISRRGLAFERAQHARQAAARLDALIAQIEDRTQPSRKRRRSA